jgi:ornithine cyclodeaminase/alanine dehydrogenase-like protein (mu-crystallin family)
VCVVEAGNHSRAAQIVHLAKERRIEFIVQADDASAVNSNARGVGPRGLLRVENTIGVKDIKNHDQPPQTLATVPKAKVTDFTLDRCRSCSRTVKPTIASNVTARVASSERGGGNDHRMATMTVKYLTVDGETIRRVLSVQDAVAALAVGFQKRSGADPIRTSVPWAAGELLVMPSEHGQFAGVKLLTVAPDAPNRTAPRIQGLYVLFDANSLTPLAVLEAEALTTLRTSAVSALVTSVLAAPEASRLVLFGTGPQARAHANAINAVRPIRSIVVVGRDIDRARDLAGDLAVELNVDAAVGSQSDVADADIVCTCTTSSTPVFEGRLLQDTAHVNAIGSHYPGAREVDDDVVRRSLVVVEDGEAARREAGDLIIPWRSGAVDDSVFALDIAKLLNEPPARGSRPTLFKSVGLGVEDLIVAREIVKHVTQR